MFIKVREFTTLKLLNKSNKIIWQNRSDKF